MSSVARILGEIFLDGNPFLAPADSHHLSAVSHHRPLPPFPTLARTAPAHVGIYRGRSARPIVSSFAAEKEVMSGCPGADHTWVDGKAQWSPIVTPSGRSVVARPIVSSFAAEKEVISGCPLGREQAGLSADRIRFRPVSDQCQTGVRRPVSCHSPSSPRPCRVHVSDAHAQSHVGFAEKCRMSDLRSVISGAQP